MSYTLHTDSQLVSGTLAGVNSEFLVVSDVSKLNQGFHEYTRVYMLRPRGEALPTFDKTLGVSVQKVAQPSIINAQGTEIGGDYDMYAFDALTVPVFSGSYSNYLPQGGFGFGSFVVVSSVPVEYTGVHPNAVRKAVEIIQTLSGNMDEYADHYAGKRPYIVKGSEYVYGIASSENGTVYLEVLSEQTDGSFRSIDSFNYMRVKQVKIDDSQAVTAGTNDEDGEEIRIVLGVVAREGDKRVVKYLTAGPGYVNGEAPAVYTNNVTATVQASSDNQQDATETSLPASEKRTRAQLYAALKEAEKFGDRTVVKSAFEDNVAQIGYDSFSHQRVPEWAETLPQGQLVSMVRALVTKLMNDRASFEQRIKALREQDSSAPSQPTQQLNIIIGGYGYDH